MKEKRTFTLPDPETCPQCGRGRAFAMNSRPRPGYRYRRRKCLHCGHRWNTYETVVHPDRLTPRY